MYESIESRRARFIKRQLSQISASILLGGLTTVFLWSIDVFVEQLLLNSEPGLLLIALFLGYAIGLSVYMGYLGLIVIEEHHKRIIRDLNLLRPKTCGTLHPIKPVEASTRSTLRKNASQSPLKMAA